MYVYVCIVGCTLPQLYYHFPSQPCQQIYGNNLPSPVSMCLFLLLLFLFLSFSFFFLISSDYEERILYEDQDFLVIDKPPGCPCSPHVSNLHDVVDVAAAACLETHIGMHVSEILREKSLISQLLLHDAFFNTPTITCKIYVHIKVHIPLRIWTYKCIYRLLSPHPPHPPFPPLLLQATLKPTHIRTSIGIDMHGITSPMTTSTQCISLLSYHLL